MRPFVLLFGWENTDWNERQIGKRLAMMELRIVITTLALKFEFLALPENLTSMAAEETIFRKPKTTYVRLKAL